MNTNVEPQGYGASQDEMMQDFETQELGNELLSRARRFLKGSRNACAPFRGTEPKRVLKEIKR